MSRSRRKSPFMGVTCAKSDKPFKVDEHRRERRKATVIVKQTADGDDPRLHGAPCGDPWLAPKDGKQPVDPRSKWMRK